MTECGCGAEQADKLERKTLKILLSINAFMFFAELTLGWLAQSTGLLADSLDMLADAAVYGLSLFAVGKGIAHQVNAARISGVLQMLLGAGVLLEVGRRAIFGSEPQSLFIMVVGVMALCANIVCLLLVAKHRQGGVHMRASWIFSTNDVIANLGVILAGILVAVMGNRFPDLVIGTIISLLVMRGGLQILKEAQQARTSKNEY